MVNWCFIEELKKSSSYRFDRHHFGTLSFYFTILDATHPHINLSVPKVWDILVFFFFPSQLFILLFFFLGFMIHFGHICLQFRKVYFKQVSCLFYFSNLYYLVMDFKHQYVSYINLFFYSTQCLQDYFNVKNK